MPTPAYPAPHKSSTDSFFTPRPTSPRQTNVKVLVTGVGGGVGQSIIKALQYTPYSVIAIDSERLATGLYTVERGYHGHYADHPQYLQRILQICRRERCALLFPGTDAELSILASQAALIQQAGTIPVVSSPEVIATCDDKLATARFLSANGYPAPITVPFDEACTASLELPFIVKPRRGGARSRGLHLLKTTRDLDYYLDVLPRGIYVAQEYISGPEYTCGSVNDSGRCLAVIVLRRTLRNGDTYKAFVEKDPLLANFVSRILDQLGPFGPCNVQLRVRDGEPYVFEFNARCSGTTYCRALAGFNEPLLTAELLLRHLPPKPIVKPTTIVRYWKELVVPNDDIAVLEETGATAGPRGRL